MMSLRTADPETPAKVRTALSAIDGVMPETGVVEAGLPRRQTGEKAQQLTVTLLADYGIRHGVSWPSAGIVALLADFGVTGSAARAALSRLARSGVLEGTRTGRNTSYRLTRAASRALKLGGRRIARFAADAEAWDGEWTLLAFSGAGEGGAPRKLRTRLRWLGYAPMYDGLWASPRADPEFTVDSLGEVRPAALTMFRGRLAKLSTAQRNPLEAWDLAWVADEYARYLQDWRWLLGPEGEDVEGPRALVARTRLMDDYRRFPALDPQLPQHMMPDCWPRHAARELFEHGYDLLGGRAEARVREVLTAQGLPIPDGLGHHAVADLTSAMSA